MQNGLPDGVHDATVFHSLPQPVQERLGKMPYDQLEMWVINNYSGWMRFEVGRKILLCCSAKDPLEECVKRMRKYL